VVYATMWHSTERMARAISEGLAAGGLRVKVMSMDEVHRSDVMYELLCAGAVAVGSPTLNNHMLPNMADILTYMRGLKPRGGLRIVRLERGGRAPDGRDPRGDEGGKGG